jgi:hypothetical protein
MLLPDTNVWLALVFDAHVHHPFALAPGIQVVENFPELSNCRVVWQPAGEFQSTLTIQFLPRTSSA